jgi:hypothetical protein
VPIVKLDALAGDHSLPPHGPAGPGIVRPHLEA